VPTAVFVEGFLADLSILSAAGFFSVGVPGADVVGD